MQAQKFEKQWWLQMGIKGVVWSDILPWLQGG